MKANYDVNKLSAEQETRYEKARRQICLGQPVDIEDIPREIRRQMSSSLLHDICTGTSKTMKGRMKNLEQETQARSSTYSDENLFSHDVTRLYVTMSRKILSLSSTAKYTGNSDFIKFLIVTVVGGYRHINTDFTHFMVSRDKGLKPLGKLIDDIQKDEYTAVDVELQRSHTDECLDKMIDRFLQLPGLRKQIERDARIALVEYMELCASLYMDHNQQAALYGFFGELKNLILDRMVGYADTTLNYYALKYFDAMPMIEKSEYDRLSSELSRVSKEASDAKSKLSRYENENEELKNKIECNRDNKYLSEVNDELYRSISRLERKCYSLSTELYEAREKLKELQGATSESDVKEEEVELPSDEDVRSKRYVFIFKTGRNRDFYIKRLLENFPNSVSLDGTYDLSSIDSCDMVVFFTQSISHAYYYKVKKYCKSKNVDFIHCNDWNMEKIIDSLKLNLV